MREELLTPQATEEEVAEEVTDEVGLRPRTLDEFVGQAELKDRLHVILEAARQRGQAADHLLFAGPPGLGKTTLSGMVATEMGVATHATSCPTLERARAPSSIRTTRDHGHALLFYARGKVAAALAFLRDAAHQRPRALIAKK